MSLVINPKTKKKENTLTSKEKKILENLEQSVDFVNKHKKGKLRDINAALKKK